jgi:hypothetical protein
LKVSSAKERYAMFFNVSSSIAGAVHACNFSSAKTELLQGLLRS